MKIQNVAIDAVHLDPANMKRHPLRNLEMIRASLARFRQTCPLKRIDWEQIYELASRCSR
jgi:hypothetical protein